MVSGRNNSAPRWNDVTCREVAPLIARFNDPDRTEAEEVRLSTHLVRCGPCRELLDHYRRHDRALRAFAPIPVAPRVRTAIYSELENQTPPYRLGILTTVAATALIVMFATSLLAYQSMGGTPALWGGQEEATGTLTQSIGGARRTADALTAVAARASASVPLLVADTGGVHGGTPFTLMAGSVALLSISDRRLVLHRADGVDDEAIQLTPSTAIQFVDGTIADLADLAVGTPVRVVCDRDAGGWTAAAIVVLR